MWINCTIMCCESKDRASVSIHPDHSSQPLIVQLLVPVRTPVRRLLEKRYSHVTRVVVSRIGGMTTDRQRKPKSSGEESGPESTTNPTRTATELERAPQRWETGDWPAEAPNGQKILNTNKFKECHLSKLLIIQKSNQYLSLFGEMLI